MKYDFLGSFTKRMKNVGLYAVLVQNIVQKTTWNKFGLKKSDEQINITFSVLLFLMENSLRESPCTMDDIAAYLDSISEYWPEKGWTFDECSELASFIINTVLSNEGVLMTFDGYDYDQRAYRINAIRYVVNEVVYLGGDVKRTSYHLTEDGYNLLLSTLEIESNMRLTIRELLFQMHLEKQSYDKAVDDIKGIFNELRIQVQRAREAMRRIRRNALDYSVTEYEEILHSQLDSISDSRPKFEAYRVMVENRKAELEDVRINSRELDDDEREKIRNLGIIGEYLDHVLDEHQRVLNSYFDLKDLYSEELENISRASMIKRFLLKKEVYDRVLDNPKALENFDLFLTPLFRKNIDKIYDPSRALQAQRPFGKRKETEETFDIEFDEAKWEEEQERLRAEKRAKYKGCMSFIFDMVIAKGKASLSDMKKQLENDPENIKRLIPSIDIFKEVMVELIKASELDIKKLREERAGSYFNNGEVFEANVMLLEILDEADNGRDIKWVYVRKRGDKKISFDDVIDEDGNRKTIRCSEVEISIGGEKNNVV
ncbi:MAG: hypothetical protein K5894_16315 [Lachnospiraceae bacterium]|nr:hypothetical protein [Lachnospiraceae bacterium]